MTETVCVLEHRRDPDRPRRAADNLLVCLGHRTGLARDLLELPGMYEQLATAHAGQRGPRSEVRSSGHAGLSLDDAVTTARAEIRTMLTTWVRAVAEDRGANLPADDPADMARWLLGRYGTVLDWCLGQDWAADFHAGIDAVHRDAFRILHPTGRRRFEVGACIEVTACDVASRVEQQCPGRMLATLTDVDDRLPASLWCDECGHEVSAAGWITYGRRVQKAMAS